MAPGKASFSAPETRRVGRYVLDEQLGVGATATAWRAHEESGTADVVLKLLHPHLLQDPVARSRLEAEATAASEVSHPGIVPVIDVHVSDSEAALVFPFIDGETLAARLNRDGPLEPREAARIAADVAAALAAVHAQGVVHRDVKPSNILLGSDGRARLLDFGIAHALNVPFADLTGAGMTVGTLPYMPPEQLAGLAASPGNDVFALGAVLYEMLAGRRPYDAPTPLALAEAHAQPPADVPDVPRPLLALAWAALSREEAARPAAGQLGEGLEAWLEDGTLPSPPMAWQANVAPTATAVAAIPPAALAAPAVASAAPAVHAAGPAGESFRPAVAGSGPHRPVLAAILAVVLLLAVTSALALAPAMWPSGEDALVGTDATPSPTTVPSEPPAEAGDADDEPADREPVESEEKDDEKDDEKGKKDKGKKNKGKKNKGKGRGHDDD